MAASSHSPEVAWQCHRDLCLTGTAVLILLNIYGEVLILTLAVFTSVLSSLVSVRGKKNSDSPTSPLFLFSRKLPLGQMAYCSAKPASTGDSLFSGASWKHLHQCMQHGEREAGPSLPPSTESKHLRMAKNGK